MMTEKRKKASNPDTPGDPGDDLSGADGSGPAKAVEELSELVEEQAREIEAREKEIELTAEVQKSLLPDEMPEIEGFELSACCLAPEGAGGDYFDFLPLEREGEGRPKPGGRWVVTIADAAGHGPSATVIMAMLHSLLHAFPGPHDDPGTILEFINRQMCKKDLAGMFATALLAIIDPPHRTFRYSSAGHHPPLLRESRGRGVRELATNKSVGLAIKPDARFESRLVRLNPLDTLLLYTDGLIEVPDESGNPFGIEALRVTLSEANGGPRQIKDVVNRAVSAHRGRAEMQDDKTLIVIQATGRAGAQVSGHRPAGR